jgi:hypothetical protein
MIDSEWIAAGLGVIITSGLAGQAIVWIEKRFDTVKADLHLTSAQGDMAHSVAAAAIGAIAAKANTDPAKTATVEQMNQAYGKLKAAWEDPTASNEVAAAYAAELTPLIAKL